MKARQEDLGFLALRNGDHQEAINLFLRALERGPSAEAYYGLGMAYRQLDNRPKALWAFHKAIEIDPHHAKASHALELLEIGSEEGIEPPVPLKAFNVRTSSDYLEREEGGHWEKFFIKGINLGLGLPGYFPGEFPIEKGTYLKWFEKIYELGINSIRLYTLHPPSFYEALYQFNRPLPKLRLIQGIWVELPPKNDFFESSYLEEVQENVRHTVDAIYGKLTLPEKKGRPSGRYRYDVSSLTLAFLFGREWEPCAVKGFNERQKRRFKSYRGSFLAIEEGTPFEAWITEMVDYVQHYEKERHGLSHPVSVINWPTLDPLIHPAESTYEENLEFQGIKVNRALCNENEDEETLDLTKIKTLRGPGFFATYHIYPYYPDFMVNGYLQEGHPFLAYLQQLKAYHGRQPVLVGEFGVPSSRINAHWHPRGWHQGGHSERQQGEINGTLMRAIYQAKMAGGILFSWFDEWFKKNWLFLPYYDPSDRKPYWYNLQDAEENYGLLSAYPGYPRKRVHLSGDRADWLEGLLLYEKQTDQMVFKFHDGFDEARYLKRVMAQHDEGFFYLFIETQGPVDFTKAHYLVGLDTIEPDRGEFGLPLNTLVRLPIGLEFLIHLAGKEKSRMLISKDYDKYLNEDRGEILPQRSDQGEWVLMLHKSNARRISKDGKRFFPARVHLTSLLRYGSLDPKHPDYDSLADFYFVDNRIEIRLPWSLLLFTDPSSRRVLWKDGNSQSKKTEGIHVLVFSYRPQGGHLFAQPTGQRTNLTDSLPERLRRDAMKAYTWEEWDKPTYHTALKPAYHQYQKYLLNIPERIE
ncbi:MAG: tetratricopeptide repeat protein [Desulfobacterota bacterium]|nr:tetratricopeptide repeat protein [Thermodesulfobacteriota bacterium]